MKKLTIILSFMFLLTGCTVDPTNSEEVTVECDSNQIEVNGVCEDKVEPKDDYDEDLIALLDSFESDLIAAQMGSQKIDFIATPVLQPIGEELQYRIIKSSKFDLINEYYFVTMDTTVTSGVDFVEYVKKVDEEYEHYFKTLDEEYIEVEQTDATFNEGYNSYVQIEFSFELTPGVISVTGGEESIYRVTVTKEYLQEHTDLILNEYLNDFTNEYVVLIIEYKQIDNEYTVSFEMVNSNPEARYKSLEVVFTYKILDLVEPYVIPE